MPQDDYFELVFKLSPDVIYSLSAEDGKLLRLNPAFERVTGMAVADWIGQPFAALLHPKDLPLAQDRMRLHHTGAATDVPFRLRVRHADGHYLVGEFSSVSLQRDGQVKEIIGIVRDITERLESDKQLKRASGLLQDLLRQSHSHNPKE